MWNKRWMFILTALIASVATVWIWMRDHQPMENDSLPIFIITADPDPLWSASEGIYTNYKQDRKIQASFQFFDKTGELLYESKAGLALFGGDSRKQKQKSLQLIAKKKYGPETFEYPFFPELQHKQYEALILRNGGQDFASSHMRDALAAMLAQPILPDTQAYRPVIVYINDTYMGIHDLREKMNAEFLSAHHDLRMKSIDLLESDGEVKNGNDAMFQELLSIMDNDEITDVMRIKQLEARVDVNNLFDYMIVETYIGNTDWPDHNIRYWRSREGDGRFRWLLYDADMSFGDPKQPTLVQLLSSKWLQHPSVRLFHLLLQEERLRNRFIDRYIDQLNNRLSPTSVKAVIEYVSHGMEPEMTRHQRRWGSSINQWKGEVDGLYQFAERRSGVIAEQLDQSFSLNDQQRNKLGLVNNQ